MKKRRGFTLLEAIVTLSILGICFGLTIGVVASLTSIQKSSSNSISLSNQLDRVDKTVQEYVSIVSIKTGTKEFTYSSENSGSTQIVFINGSEFYTLKYLNKQISITKTGDAVSYLPIQYDIKDIDGVVFSFNEELALLSTDVEISSTHYKFAYTIRTLL